MIYEIFTIELNIFTSNEFFLNLDGSIFWASFCLDDVSILKGY